MAGEFQKMLSKEAVSPNETMDIKPISAPFQFVPETIGNDFNSCRPFVNDCLNSRLVQTLPDGRWMVRASSSLDSGARPNHILHTADRILLQGDGPWRLYDQDCQVIATGYRGGSDILLDADNNLFFFSNSTGMLEARHLLDGNRSFSAPLIFGHKYERTFIARKNEQMVIVSTEREIDQDAEKKPERSIVETLKFNEPPIIDQDGMLLSAENITELKRQTLLLLAAFQNGTLVTATNDQICLLDLDLQIKTAINGNFTPFVMSLNDAGIMYLVVNGELPKLRAITPNGERIFSAELPESMLNIYYPPIIGYDNRIFLIKNDFLMAFAQNGYELWEYKSRNQIAGAVVTADNQLLICDGSELGVIELSGKYKTLYNFENEILQTPPTITRNGDLVVATDKKLYCLTLQKN